MEFGLRGLGLMVEGLGVRFPDLGFRGLSLFFFSHKSAANLKPKP